MSFFSVCVLLAIKKKKQKNMKQSNVHSKLPIGKTGLPFQNFLLSREFSSGMNQKNVNHLHPNGNFREFLVNCKQPVKSKSLGVFYL